MPEFLESLRYLSFKAQGGRCYYCGAPIWQHDPAEFAARHGLTLRLARRLQCTAEHLVARRDGGKSKHGNIVAACLFCNSNRHRRRRAPSASAYRKLVARRMGRQKWHPEQIHRMLASSPTPAERRPAQHRDQVVREGLRSAVS